MTGEEHSNGSYDEVLEPNQSADECLEFSNLVASVKLTINRPPLPDIIERPKSSLPRAKASSLAVSQTYLYFPEQISDQMDYRHFLLTQRSLESFVSEVVYESRLGRCVCV